MSQRYKNIVVTGGNRGIGLGLVKQLLSKFKPDNLFATYRDTQSSTELLELARKYPNLHPIQLDVRDADKYGDFVKTVEGVTGEGGINLLINNAAVNNVPDNASISQLTKDDMMFHYEVNTVGPVLLTQAFLPLLEKGSGGGGQESVVLLISSTLGSITCNTELLPDGVGGVYSYRLSKSAVNQAAKTMSIELKDKPIIVFPLCPGWVKTDLGGPNALLEVEESVAGILSVLETVDKSSNGKFRQYTGEEQHW